MNKKYIRLFAILSLYNNINTGMMGEIFNPRTRSFAAKEMSNRFFGRNQNVSHLTHTPRNNISRAYLIDKYNSKDVTNKTVINELLDDKSLVSDPLEGKIEFFKKLLGNNPQLLNNHKGLLILLEHLNAQQMSSANGNDNDLTNIINKRIANISTKNMPLRILLSPLVEKSFLETNNAILYNEIVKKRLNEELQEQNNKTMITLEEYIKHPEERIWYTESADRYLLNQEKLDSAFLELGINNSAKLTPSLKTTLTNYLDENEFEKDFFINKKKANYIAKLNNADINNVVKEYTNAVDGYRYKGWDANRIKGNAPIFDLLANIANNLTLFDVKYQDGDYELFRSEHGFASERAFGDFLKNYINVKEFPEKISNIEKLEFAIRAFLDQTIKESKILGDLKSTRKDY